MSREGIGKIRALMSRRQLDAVVLLKSANMAYALDVEDVGYPLAAVILRDDVVVYVRRLDYYRALEELRGKDVKIYSFSKAEMPPRLDGELLVVETSLWNAISKELRERGAKRVGVDSEAGELREALERQDVKMVDVSSDVMKVRAVKDREEIRRIEMALSIAERCFSELLKFIRPGVRERDIAALILSKLVEYGADEPAFMPIVASGRNSSFPHVRFTDKRLEAGEPVVIDLGCRFKLYCSDLTRTVCIGNVTSNVRDAYGAVLEALKTATKSVRPGVSASDVDKAARDVLREYGYDKHFIHGLGHGIGIEVHERPRIGPASSDVLESCNVITLEPGVYLKDGFGVRVENMIFIEEGTCKVLNRISSDLFVT